MDLTKIAFDSRLNYLKKDTAISGSITIALSAGGGGATFDTINHNLGYVPFVIVGGELQNTTTVWSNDYVHTFTQSSASSPNYPVTFTYWWDSTTLTIILINGAGTGQQSGNRTFYYNIYRDYES
jgi:hypothetical protein